MEARLRPGVSRTSTPHAPADHAGHDRHAGHSVAMFREKF
jgi:hypothetical protein